MTKELLAINSERFNNLNKAFWVYVFFSMCLILYIIFIFDKDGLNLSILFLITPALGAAIFYLYFLAKLVSEAHKNIFLWLIGTVLLGILGFIISYIRIRGISKRNGWLSV